MPKGKQADDQRTVTFSGPKELVEKIDEAAEQDGRSRSNWVVYQLRKIIDARKQGKLVALPDAARVDGSSSDSMSARVAEDPAPPSPRGKRRP